jgi:hypothetical protein
MFFMRSRGFFILDISCYYFKSYANLKFKDKETNMLPQLLKDGGFQGG